MIIWICGLNIALDVIHIIKLESFNFLNNDFKIIMIGLLNTMIMF